MDIGEISAQYMAMTNPALQSRNTIDDSRFEDVLKRVQATQTKSNIDSEPSSRSSNIIPIDKTDRLYELCLELETFLVKNLLSSMRSTVQKSGLINEGFAGKMYEDMLYDEYAKDFTKNAGFGLAEQAYRQLVSHQNNPYQ